MGKDDEDVFVRFFAGRGVYEWRFDFCIVQLGSALFSGVKTMQEVKGKMEWKWKHTRIVHVQVTAKDAPEDTLKRGHAVPVDCARDKFKVKARKTAFSGQSTVFGSMLEEACAVVPFVERGTDLGMPVLGLTVSLHLSTQIPLLYISVRLLHHFNAMPGTSPPASHSPINLMLLITRRHTRSHDAQKAIPN